MSSPPDKPHVALRTATWSAVTVTSVLLALAALHLYRHDPYWGPRWMVDFKVYMASGEAVRHGQSLYHMFVVSPLYGHMPYIYPPLTSLMFFVGLSLIPLQAANLIWNSASLIALAAVVWLTLGMSGVRDQRTRSALTLVGLLLAACLMPVRMNLIAGQVNLFLLLLVVWDFSRPATSRWKGVGIGIAAGLKITPLIFIAYLLITRRWAAARTAALSFVGTIALGFLILPHDSATYWGGTFLQSSRAGGIFDTPNQSLAGEMARVLTSSNFQTWWLAVLAAVAVLGLAVARYAHHRGADFLGFSAAAITGLLVSPISWEHHWVYIIPLLIWLACQAYRTRSWPVAAVTVVLAAIFTVRTFMVVGITEAPPVPLDMAVWKEIVAGAYPVTGLLLLVLGPMWIRHRFPAPPAAGRHSAGGDGIRHAPAPAEPQPAGNQRG